jgi:hypothetical protein
VQRPGESALGAATLLARAGASKGCELMILIITGAEPSAIDAADWPPSVVTVESARRQIAKLLDGRATARARADAGDQINLR